MLRAIVFDFNGVILDDEELHYEALRRVLEEEGISLAREVYYRSCLGFNDVQCFTWALKDPARIHKAGGLDRLVQRKAAYYQKLVERGARFFPGVKGFIVEAASRYPLAVASMALRGEIEAALEKAGLSGLFRAIVSGEEVARTKPDPEVYIKALRRLNEQLGLAQERRILPVECLAIEDSVAGIRSARSAGMRVLGLAHTEEQDSLGEADWVLPSLQGCSIARIQALFESGGTNPQ